MRVYDAIVRGVASTGVDAAFGGAGENAASLMLALKNSGTIRPVIARHEQAASFMACGYAMFTDKLGFCFATAGPGAFNLFSGLAVALSDSYPVLAVTGYSNREWIGRGSLNETSGVNGTPDSRAMFAATTKQSFFVENAADTCDVLEQALRVAFEGRPGPVHIHVPEDLTHPHVEVENYRDPRIDLAPVVPDPAEIEGAAQALASAWADGLSVVLLVGFGAIRSGAYDEVARLAERYRIPVLTTLDGKGILPENHPLNVGVFADSGHARAWKTFQEADVVLAVGNSLNQHATFNYRPDLFDGKTLVHVNISAREIGKAYKTQHRVVGDATLAVRALTEALTDRVGSVVEPTLRGRDYEARRIPHLHSPIHPGKLAQAIGKMLPPGAILLADAGAHLAWLGYYVELEAGQNFRKAGTFGPMAGHVNGAIGVKMANPQRTVVVGCGDGCYNLSGFELMTAVEHGVGVIWVIFDDREFKLIKLYQVTTYYESGLVEFENPDYAAYARACGADGYTVETLDEFESAFEEALRSGRPSVIDARITRWAVPHYSPSPDGVIAGLVERVEQTFRGE